MYLHVPVGLSKETVAYLKGKLESEAPEDVEIEVRWDRDCPQGKAYFTDKPLKESDG